MSSVSFTPDPALRPFVRSYFHIRTPATELRFPSDACPGLIINLGASFLFETDAGCHDNLSGCRLFGFFTRSFTTRSTRPVEVLAVKFRPGMLFPFFRIAGVELTDRSVPLDLLWGRRGVDLEDQVRSARDMSEATRRLDRALVSCLDDRSVPDPRFHGALSQIIERGGNVTVTDIARAVSLSPRQLERGFSRAIGLPPKRFCRVMRFSRVLSQVRDALAPDWADIAYASGFSDQAHLVRECKYFTGQSPQQYLRHLTPIERMVMGLSQPMSNDDADGSHDCW